MGLFVRARGYADRRISERESGDFRTRVTAAKTCPELLPTQVASATEHREQSRSLS